ncbi:SLOG family protein [Streptomyces sp. Tu6071]|uniref:SLOG family protein n=1 Tax=Streptomyces sp. Tu6071 TaxID=355249 RepID=UPI0018F88374
MRVLVTGSREWIDWRLFSDTLRRWAMSQGCAPQEVVIVAGGCKTGADAMAKAFAETYRTRYEEHPVTAEEWERHGKRAAYLRNARMVDSGADVCFGFKRGKSAGTTMTLGLAVRAGIPVHVIKEQG